MNLRRHPLDLFSLLSGLVTVLLAAVALTDAWSRPLAPWALPVVLIAAGVVVLCALAVASRPGREEPAAHGGAADDGALRAELRADEAAAAPWPTEDPGPAATGDVHDGGDASRVDDGTTDGPA